MAAVEVTISGMLYDKINRTTQNVVLIGEATLTGVGIGGGPIYPPPGGGGGDGKPPGIWGPTDPRPTPPIAFPPGWVGGVPPGGWPDPPTPPGSNIPPPGSPPVIVPGTTPTHPITPPAAVLIDYPGIGKVVVPQPTQTGGAPR